jgi:flagellum-specific ATP synthase
LAAHRDHEDLISIGAYRRGSNRTVDAAVEILDDVNRYLRQPIEQPSTSGDAREGLLQLYRQYQERLGAQQGTPQSKASLERAVAPPT